MVNKKLHIKSFALNKSKQLSDSEIYHIMMLHSYQHKNCSQIAKQFGVTQGEIYEIISCRKNTSCCG